MPPITNTTQLWNTTGPGLQQNTVALGMFTHVAGTLDVMNIIIISLIGLTSVIVIWSVLYNIHRIRTNRIPWLMCVPIQISCFHIFPLKSTAARYDENGNKRPPADEEAPLTKQEEPVEEDAEDVTPVKNGTVYTRNTHNTGMFSNVRILASHRFP
jgi:hypothetical protein